MIINDNDAIARLNNPMNLMNKLKTLSSKKNSAMSLFIPPKRDCGSEGNKNNNVEQSETTLDTILKDNESQIKLGLAHDSALKLLNDSVALLSAKLDDVKADKLPSVISSASKVVEGIRKERILARVGDKEREVHYHFYTPKQNVIADYEVIEVQ